MTSIGTNNIKFKVVTIGWEPNFINYLLNPISEKSGISFIHGLVGDVSRLKEAKIRYPKIEFEMLSKEKNCTFPIPDHEFLASLECEGIPTIRSMIQGDRVLRHLPADRVLAYATFQACKIREVLIKHQPDLVLGSYDSLHAALSLAVAKYLGIPWVAMAFTVIPNNLTGFCRGLTPNCLVSMPRIVDDGLRGLAKTTINNVRSKQQKILAFRPPTSVNQWILQYCRYGKNLFLRIRHAKALGIDKYTYPSVRLRLNDIVRRLLNRLQLPENRMLQTPPSGRYIYYPFHMAPESMLDTWAPFYQNQIAFVTQLSLAIPIDTSFVIKLHFSDPDNYSCDQLEQLMRLPRLYIAHPNAEGSIFIEKSAVVVGIQGTSCLEGALLGKPVLIFGDSPYQYFPRTERAKRPDELYSQICRMLDMPPATDNEIVEAYATYMARYMPGRINDWSKPIGEGDLAKLTECFRRLRLYVEEPGNRANWYNQPPFVSTQSSKTDPLSCQF